MKYGYARVSTSDQNLDLQRDSLKNEGCKKIFMDRVTGAKAERPGLSDLWDHLATGDMVVVWKLDRLGRSLKHLIALINDLEAKGVGFKSLKESIDTTTSAGKLVFHIFGALAEFERGLISERTKAGLESARARGRKGGRKKGLSEHAKLVAIAARALYEQSAQTGLGVAAIVEKLGISKPTLYKYLRHQGVEIGTQRRKPARRHQGEQSQ